MQIRMPLLAAVCVTAIWGLNVVALKIGVTEIPPSLLNTLRFALLAVLLLPFARIPWSTLPSVLLIGLLMGVGHFYLLTLGASYVSSNTTVIIVITGAPISSLLAYLLKMEKLSRKQMTGITIAFSGTAIPLLLSGSVDLTLGTLIIVASMTFWAMTNIIIRKLDDIPLLSLQFWIGIITAPACFFGYYLAGNSMDIVSQITVPVIITVVYMVIFSSIIGYYLWFAIINQHGINRIVHVTLLQPLFTMVFAYLLLDEVLSGPQLLSAGVTLAGMGIYYHKKRCDKAAAQAALNADSGKDN
ncbi:DMT family transporter [Aliamphritea ceti]|uniref:DMT family transporter n=1 Tax=Aliamphritea ceti TaxID=1524258 RepID=UPI0021C31DB6|nr:EamA family transporter [Aliamphritea ceti]